MQTHEESHYRRYRASKTCKCWFKSLCNGRCGPTRLLIEGAPGPKEWALLDIDNGNPERGYGYLWIYNTREKARVHKRLQNTPSLYNAELIGPWQVMKLTGPRLARWKQKHSP